MWVFDVLLAWTCTSFCAISSAPWAECWCWVDLVMGVCACSDHLYLVLSAIHGPVLASSPYDFILLEEVSLIPAESDLSDLIISIEVDKVRLNVLAASSEPESLHIPLAT